MNLPSFRALRVWRRNLIVWRHGAMWSSLFGDLAEPILYLFGLGYGFGFFVEKMDGVDYMQFVAPGVLAMGAMWSASFELTYGAFTRLDRQKTYQAIMVTPVDVEDVVAGDIIWGATKASIGGAMVLVVTASIGVAQFPWALGCLGTAFLAGWAFGAISLTFTAVARNYDFFTYYFTLGLTPIVLLSEAWYPLDGFPVGVQVAAHFSPLTHAVRASRMLMSGRLEPLLGLHLAVLTIYGLVFSLAAIVLIRRRLVR